MENMEILAAEEAAEKVEQTTEESPKIYSQAEFNAKLDEILGKKLARREAKLRRELEKKEPALSEETLARAEAETILRGGEEQVAREVERLSGLGMENMSGRDKAVFRDLAEHQLNTRRARELEGLGVSEEVWGSEEFRRFAALFAPKTPTAEIFRIYSDSRPKEQVHTMGTVKSKAAEGEVKDFYTREEALRFTKRDFDRNPQLFRAVEKSMTRW